MLAPTKSSIITPYGGKLVDLLVPEESLDELNAYASQLPSIQISARSVSDLEMFSIGAFSPLDRFMGQDDYERVLSEMRLVDGNLFPMPITLPVAAFDELHLDSDIAIRNNEYDLLAILTIEEIYTWNRDQFANVILDRGDYHHSLMSEMQNWGPLNISGKIQVLQLPRHNDFQDLRLTPNETRAKLTQLEPQDVVAVQPNSPIFQNLEDINGIVLLQLAVGTPKLGDYEYFTLVRTYRDLSEKYLEPNRYLLSLLPLSSHLAGARDALWQALIHRNFGANRSYVGVKQRNHSDSRKEERINNPYENLELIQEFSQELNMDILPIQVPAGNGDRGRSNGNSEATIDVLNTSPYAINTKNLPWHDFQIAVTDYLSAAQSPRHKKGVCIWFTGLSGSGKSTTTELLAWSLLEHGRRVTVLDGDVVRTNLSKGLSFSKADRDTNVRRIGFVASELVRQGGVVICAVVSPYRAARNDVRNMIGKDQFVEVYVNTPLEVCEARDVKGFYAKARRDEIQGFTGIDDPYEPPEHPEITLDTSSNTPHDNANFIIDHLIEIGFIQDEQMQD